MTYKRVAQELLRGAGMPESQVATVEVHENTAGFFVSVETSDGGGYISGARTTVEQATQHLIELFWLRTKY